MHAFDRSTDERQEGRVAQTCMRVERDRHYDGEEARHSRQNDREPVAPTKAAHRSLFAHRLLSRLSGHGEEPFYWPNRQTAQR